MKAFCPECNQEQGYNIIFKNENLLGYPIQVVNCSVCNEKLYVNEIIEANVKSFNKFFDKK